METALQELIKELIIELRSKYDYLLLTITEREEHKTHGEIFALNAAIHTAKAKLPKERKEIEEAHEAGQITAMEFANRMITKDKIESKEQYYETNFNTNKV